MSCNDFLDVIPDNRSILDSKSKISKILVTAYPDQSPWLLAEFSSDNTDDNTNKWSTMAAVERPAFLWKDVDDIDNDSPQAVWEACYKAIATANQALDAIEKIGNEDGSLNAQKGEALLARAHSHLILTNMFCKSYSSLTSVTDLGIPYMENPETTVNPQYERGTVAEVYEKINRDIEKGLPLISESGYAVPKYHFNKKAAYALAARFNLYYGNYANVIRYANLVLGTDPSSVLRDWKVLGAETNFEKRANMFINVANPANLLLTDTYSYWPLIHGPHSVGSRYSHNQVISDNETSGSTGPWGAYTNFYLHYFSFTGGVPKYQVMKYGSDYFEYTDPVAGIGYRHMVQVDYTTDETLLCRAEAYALLGDYKNATQDLVTELKAFSRVYSVDSAKIVNFYKNLNYYTPKAPTAKKRLNPDFVVKEGAQENFIQAILHLRRIVTIHEGLRWQDVKRYGIEVYRRKVDGSFISLYDDVLRKDDPRRALQIPKNVISAGLEPNPR